MFRIQGVLCQKSDLWKKSFSMISRLEIILSVVSYERKDIVFMKNLKFTKNKTFNSVLKVGTPPLSEFCQ